MPKNRPYPDHVRDATNANAKDKKAGAIRLPLADYKAVGQRKRPALESIKRFCLDCQGGQKKEVARCTSVGCDLYFFRTGENAWIDADLLAENVEEAS